MSESFIGLTPWKGTLKLKYKSYIGLIPWQGTLKLK